jgi:hypothetical protein
MNPSRAWPPGLTVVGSATMCLFFAALVAASSAATASGTLVPGLEQRLRTDGPEKVNTYLNAQPSSMAELNQRTADCEPDAVALAVKLSRSGNAKATDLHRESLRIAMGACTEYVLSLLTLKEVPKICASASTWTVTQTARELRRRIRYIESDESLRSTERGKACSAAYRFELENTRVGIRAVPPASRSR